MKGVFRSRRFQMFFNIGVLKNFAKFIAKTPMLDSLFNKVSGLQAYNFIKKRPRHKCFPVIIANFLGTAFSMEHLWWLLLSFTINFQKF